MITLWYNEHTCMKGVMRKVYHMTTLYMSVDIVLIVVILTGGFFMFRKFLRQMRNDKNK